MMKKFMTALVFLMAAAAVFPVLFLICGSLMGDTELSQASYSGSGKRGRVCLLEADAFVSYVFSLCGIIIGFAGIFCYVLEFCKDYSSDPYWADSCRNPCSMGICQIPLSGKKASVYYLYRFDDDAFSGNDAQQLSGTGSDRTSGYADRDCSACCFFYFSGIFDVPFFSGASGSGDGFCKNRRSGEWKIFFSIGIPLGSPGMISALVLGFLEYWNLIEQHYGIFKNKRKMASFPVPSKYRYRTGRQEHLQLLYWCFSGCPGISGGAGLSGTGNCLNSSEGVGEMKRKKILKWFGIFFVAMLIFTFCQEWQILSVWQRSMPLHLRIRSSVTMFPEQEK